MGRALMRRSRVLQRPRTSGRLAKQRGIYPPGLKGVRHQVVALATARLSSASRIMVVRARCAVETPVILSAVRTPIGKFQGGLAGFSATELGAKAVAEAIRRAGIDAQEIDEAILGNGVQAGLGQNPARQAALKGGCDPRVAAMTINKVCGSGLKAV